MNSDGIKKSPLVFSRVAIWLVLVVIVYPVFFVINTSLKKTSEFYTNVWGFPKELALGNYIEAWVTARLGSYFFNSVVVVVTSTLLALVAGALAGYALARLRLPFAGVALALVVVTQFLPLESVIMPLYIMMSRLNLLGNFATLIIPYTAWALPMTILIYKNFMEGVPPSLLEAARVDGCNELRSFFHIMLPLILPATATNAILNFVGLWGELMWVSISSATTNFGTVPLGIITFKQQFSTNWGPLSAAICIVLVPLIVLFLFTQKYFARGISAGAVKG